MLRPRPRAHPPVDEPVHRHHSHTIFVHRDKAKLPQRRRCSHVRKAACLNACSRRAPIPSGQRLRLREHRRPFEQRHARLGVALVDRQVDRREHSASIIPIQLRIFEDLLHLLTQDPPHMRSMTRGTTFLTALTPLHLHGHRESPPSSTRPSSISARLSLRFIPRLPRWRPPARAPAPPTAPPAAAHLPDRRGSSSRVVTSTRTAPPGIFFPPPLAHVVEHQERSSLLALEGDPHLGSRSPRRRVSPSGNPSPAPLPARSTQARARTATSASTGVPSAATHHTPPG